MCPFRLNIKGLVLSCPKLRQAPCSQGMPVAPGQQGVFPRYVVIICNRFVIRPLGAPDTVAVFVFIEQQLDAVQSNFLCMPSLLDINSNLLGHTNNMVYMTNRLEIWCFFNAFLLTLCAKCEAEWYPISLMIANDCLKTCET